ncbi:MAG: hypothetical protein EHM80_05385 [Nitrospiraceae bacterium]|nr:MAG: hypothetical protein EHM80_05385 [Nitrospiraceae bacterium]
MADPAFSRHGFVGFGFAFWIEAKLQVLLLISLFFIWIQRTYYFQMIVQDIQGLIQERSQHILGNSLIEGLLGVEQVGGATLDSNQRQDNQEHYG